MIIPVEPSAKGWAAVEGLELLVIGLQDQLDVEVGVLAAVLSGFKDTRDQRKILDEIDYSIPVIIGERGTV